MTLADILQKMKSGNSLGSGLEQTATATHTSTAAETTFTTVNATMPNGAVGRPLVLRAAGSVGGIVRIQIGNGTYYELQVAPNQNAVEYAIPKTAFSNRTNAVPIEFECTGGVGTLIGTVVFATD